MSPNCGLAEHDVAKLIFMDVRVQDTENLWPWLEGPDLAAHADGPCECQRVRSDVCTNVQDRVTGMDGPQQKTNFIFRPLSVSAQGPTYN